MDAMAKRIHVPSVAEQALKSFCFWSSPLPSVQFLGCVPSWCREICQIRGSLFFAAHFIGSAAERDFIAFKCLGRDIQTLAVAPAINSAIQKNSGQGLDQSPSWRMR